jgi:hypothetical protein
VDLEPARRSDAEYGKVGMLGICQDRPIQILKTAGEMIMVRLYLFVVLIYIIYYPGERFSKK